MKRLQLVILMMFFVVISLSCVDTVKGLGSYFDYLIPDTEQDVKLFPDKLSQLNSRHLEAGTKQSGNSDFYISTVPIIGKVTTRHDLQYFSHGSSSVNIEGTHSSQNQKIDFENYFSCKFGNRILGVLAAYSCDNDESERIQNGEQISYYNYSKFSNITDSNIENYGYSFGLSTNLGNAHSTSISATFSNSERKQNSATNYCSEEWYENLLEYDRLNSLVVRDKYDTQNLSLAIIHDVQKENFDVRYYSSIIYIQFKNNDYDLNFQNRTYYDSTLVTDERNEYELTNEINNSENYSFIFGTGFSKQTTKIDMFGGIKFTTNYTYSEIDYEYYQYMTDYNYYNSSTIGDTISINSSYDTKSYGGRIDLPVGFKFKPYKWLQIFSSIILSARYTYSDYENENYQNWTSKTGQNISFAILPYENVEIGVYYLSDFANFRDWQIHVKYSF